MKEKRTLSICLFITLFFSGCADNSLDGDKNGNIIYVEISQEYLKIATGDTTRLHATIRQDNGDVIEGEMVEWSVDDTSILSVSENGLINAKNEGETVVRATVTDVYDELSVEVFNYLGKAQLENQIDHGAVMVSWLPLGEEQEFGGDGEGYVVTDSLGYYILPGFEDGDWVITAEYPYYALARDTITVIDGIPRQPLEDLHLTQQLVFEVVLDKTEYSVNDTISIKFKANNVTNDTLTVYSIQAPIYSMGYAITKNAEPLLIQFDSGRVFGYIFQDAGVPSFDFRTLLPGETVLEVSSESWPGFDMYIDLDFLYEYGAIEIGETYEIYAGYVANWTYPSQYFVRASQQTINEKLLNYSLYKKLTPLFITIID